MERYTLTLLCLPCLALAAAPLLEERFESDIPELRQGGWAVPDNAAVVATEKAGNRCLQVECREEKAYVEYFVPVKPGGMYSARARARCEDVRDAPASPMNRGAVLFCQFADAEKRWVPGGAFPKGLHGTHDWTRLEVRYTAAIPETVAFIQVMIGIEGRGTAWFDDVRVQEITDWHDPALLSPADGAVVDSRRPLLTWESSLPEESYRLQVSADPDFPAAFTRQTEVWGGEIRPEPPLRPGDWFWRVRTVSARSRLPWTSARSFTVPTDAVPWPPTFRPG